MPKDKLYELTNYWGLEHDEKCREVIAGAGGRIVGIVDTSLSDGGMTLLFMGSESCVQQVRTACEALSQEIMITARPLSNTSTLSGCLQLGDDDQETFGGWLIDGYGRQLRLQGRLLDPESRLYHVIGKYEPGPGH